MLQTKSYQVTNNHQKAEMLKIFWKIFKIFLGMSTAPSPDTFPLGGGPSSPYSTSFGASVLHLLMLSRPTFHFFPTSMHRLVYNVTP